MSIKVKFFASLRELTGKSETLIEYRKGMTASQIWTLIADMEMPEDTMVAINMEYVKGDPITRDNDEVAFFPSVTGG